MFLFPGKQISGYILTGDIKTARNLQNDNHKILRFFF